MKRANKYLSLALALIMALSLCVTAFAEDAVTTGTITIDNAVAKETYDLYKVFDSTFIDAEHAVYTYTKTGAEDAVYTALTDDNSIFKLTETTTPNVFNVELKAADTKGEAVATFLKNNIIGKLPEANKQSQVATSTTVTFSGLDFGYYYIESSLGALVTINTTTPTVTVKEKNVAPSIVKKIVDGNNLVDEITADIKDVVNFKITITDGKGTDNAIVLHDTMENGLTLDATSIQVDGAAITDAIGTVESSEHAFTINFKDTYIAGLEENETIVVTYAATLNENAEIFTNTNDNSAWITYSNQETEKDIVKVETHQFNVFKYTGDNKTPLATAKFVLKNADNQFAKATLNGTVYTFNGWTANEQEAMTFVAPETTAEFTIKGLAEGTYSLIETEAPKGYNKLTAPVEVKIEVVEKAEEATTVEVMQLSQDDVSVERIEIKNSTGTVLPSTGGVGTTMFYVLGSVMMIGAAVLLVTKKKMANEQ